MPFWPCTVAVARASSWCLAQLADLAVDRYKHLLTITSVAAQFGEGREPFLLVRRRNALLGLTALLANLFRRLAQMIGFDPQSEQRRAQIICRDSQLPLEALQLTHIGIA